MSFEQRILMELKAEITARADRRRRNIRRLYMGTAVAMAAATAAIVLPLLTGSERPAYAVTENSDGTINVKLNEFRDADKLEQDLLGMGLSADITYLEPGKACKGSRGVIVGGRSPAEPKGSTADPAARMTLKGFEIIPKNVGQGQTLVMTASGSKSPNSGPEAEMAWMFSAAVVDGEVKPCVIVDSPHRRAIVGSDLPPTGS